MTKLEELLENARKAINNDNTNWPPSPQAVIDALEPLQKLLTLVTLYLPPEERP